MGASIQFNSKDRCEKIQACDVNADVTIYLDPENPTGIILDSSWGIVKLDLESIVKAGETVTRLELAPELNPTAIRFIREDGEYDCITGDEISRLVSLTLLKDVDQTTPVADGDVYMYDGTHNVFKPFDLNTFVSNTNTVIGRLQARIETLENKVADLEDAVDDHETRITNLENTVAKPDGIPGTARLVYGNVNFISDPTNTNNRLYGIFSHDASTVQFGDEFFA